MNARIRTGPGEQRRRAALVLLAGAIREQPDAAWAVLRAATLARGRALDPALSGLELDGIYAHRVADALEDLPPALSIQPRQLEDVLASAFPGLDPREVWDRLRQRVVDDVTRRGTLA